MKKGLRKEEEEGSSVNQTWPEKLRESRNQSEVSTRNLDENILPFFIYIFLNLV